MSGSQTSAEPRLTCTVGSNEESQNKSSLFKTETKILEVCCSMFFFFNDVSKRESSIKCGLYDFP